MGHDGQRELSPDPRVKLSSATDLNVSVVFSLFDQSEEDVRLLMHHEVLRKFTMFPSRSQASKNTGLRDYTVQNRIQMMSAATQRNRMS